MRFLFLIIWIVATEAFGEQGIFSVGSEENLGAGRLSNVAVDGNGSPVVVADGGANCYVYRRTGGSGSWYLVSVDTSRYFSKQFYNPYVDVDSAGGIWVSGILYPLTSGTSTNGKYVPTDAGGIGLVVLRDGQAQFSRHHYHSRSWECGNLGFDHYLDKAVIWINEGKYGVFGKAGDCPGLCVQDSTGLLSAGKTGEGARIGISHAGPYAHKNGAVYNVWHVAAVLYKGYGISGYQNSARAAEGKGVVGWADGSFYPYMGTDGSYVSVIGDGVMPLTAYMGTDLSNDGGSGEVHANVFDGKEMVRPATNIIQVYPQGGSGSRRFEPMLAAAKYGGAFIAFTVNGVVYIRYISPVGVLGKMESVCKGSKCSMAFDKDGNLHVAYCGTDGKLKYRRVQMTTATEVSSQFAYGGKAYQSVYDLTSGAWYVKSIDDDLVLYGFQWGGGGMEPVSGDYDGDGYGDAAVWSSADTKWYIYSPRKKEVLVWGWALGMPWAKPVPGDYDGDGRSDLAIYDSREGKWYVTATDGRVIAWGLQWGYPRAVAVPGDYDGDKKWDLAVYDEDLGDWYVWSPWTGELMAWARNLGVKNAAPVSGDFNGDGKHDLCVWSRDDAKWYAATATGNPFVSGHQWGYKGAVPVGGDFDGDGSWDFGTYDASGVMGYGKWYVWSPKKGCVLVWDKGWGYRGTIPAGAALDD